MSTLRRWGIGAVLPVGLVILLAAGTWAADQTMSGTRYGAPRVLQPVPEDTYTAVNRPDPAPPTPAEFKPINAGPKKPPVEADKAPARTPPAAGCAGGSGAPATSCPLNGAGGCAAPGAGCATRGGMSGCGLPACCPTAVCPAERWLDIGDCSDGCPWWSATVGAMVLHRSGVRDYVIGAGPLTSGQFDEGWATGPRFEIARHYQKWDMEFVYWSVENWNDELMTAVPGQRQEFASYGSRLYNWEWNLKRKFAPLTFLAGLRYMELQERLCSEEASPPVSSLDLRRAANYLYGFQLGAEAELAHGERFSLGAFVKAGAFANHVQESTTSLGDATRSETALVGETGLSAKLRLTGHLSVYGAYEVLWIDGVVLAPDTLGTVALGQTELNTPFYHGANVGLEFCW